MTVSRTSHRAAYTYHTIVYTVYRVKQNLIQMFYIFFSLQLSPWPHPVYGKWFPRDFIYFFDKDDILKGTTILYNTLPGGVRLYIYNMYIMMYDYVLSRTHYNIIL